jgi:hypothetical protein
MFVLLVSVFFVGIVDSIPTNMGFNEYLLTNDWRQCVLHEQ